LADCFWPKPKVDSALISFDVYQSVEKKYNLKKEDIKIFFRMLKFAFVCKRKMLKNNLSAGLRLDDEQISKILEEIGLNKKIRAQDLDVLEWVKLFCFLKKFMI
jgi:16S rRNA (adenine1518-N6/adenine1519-N6)-dimethyltransferase